MTSLPLSWMELASRIGWTLLHSLWEGTLIAGILAITLVLLCGRSSQARYVACLAALSMMVAAGTATFRLEVPTPTANSPISSGTFAAVVTSRSKPAPRTSSPLQLPIDPPTAPVVQSSTQLSDANVEPPDVHKWLEPVLPLLATLWAAGVLALSLWHVGGWVAAQRLRVLGVCDPDDRVFKLAQSLARRFGMSKPVRVLVSSLAQTPMVIGWLSPVILLPAAVVSGFTPKQLEGILAHELAHVRRHDYLLNLFQMLIETLFFYHPAIWWMSRRAKLEREQCSDEVAVAVCGDRYMYVESLAALEELRFGAAIALAARGSGGRQLLLRIRRVLGLDAPSPRAGRVIIAILVLMLGMMMPLKIMRGAPEENPPATQAVVVPRLQFRLVAEDAGASEVDELKDPDSGKPLRVIKRVQLDESDVKEARAAKTPTGELTVNLEFTKSGAEKLAKLTAANLHRRLAVVLDGKVILAALIQSVVSNSLMISGGSNGFTPEKAAELVSAIESARHPGQAAPATAPTTRHASAFLADCVLSALADGKRKVLASPSLNLEDGGEAGFLFAGKLPVIIQQESGTEAGTFSTVRLERQPDGRFRIVCRLAERPGPDEDETRHVHFERLAKLDKRLKGSVLLLLNETRQFDRASGTLKGTSFYTTEEISRVDPEIVTKLKSADMAWRQYDPMLAKYGGNYPAVIDLEHRWRLRKQDIADAVKRFNHDFLIVPRGDGEPSLVIPRDLPKLQAIVDDDVKAYNGEMNAPKEFALAGGVQTDQTVKPGEPVAVELGDGTRLEVSVRDTDR